MTSQVNLFAHGRSVANAAQGRHFHHYLKDLPIKRHATWCAICGAYFLIAVAVYMPLEGWGCGDCLYFAVVAVTTVGYGDFLPTTDASKIFTSLFVIFALVVVAVSLSNLFEAFRSHMVEKFQRETKTGVFEQEENHRRHRRRFLIAFAVFMLLLLVGTIFFATMHDWAEEDGGAWVNGFYLSVITLTTIGFGDFAAESDTEKVFDVAFMLVGIPVFGHTLATFATWVFSHGDSVVAKDELRVVKGLDRYKFGKVRQFCGKLKEHGLTSDDTKIDKFEFLCFLLQKNDLIDFSNIQEVVKNFRELDIDGTGEITEEDVIIWEAGQSGRKVRIIDGDIQDCSFEDASGKLPVAKVGNKVAPEPDSWKVQDC